MTCPGDQEGRLNLILGDSVAVYLDLPLGSNQYVLNLARSGNTWAKEKRMIKEHLDEWKDEARKSGLGLGKILYG